MNKQNLRDWDLRYADLRHAALQYVNLRDANLQHAKLWGAKIWGADLRGAKLQNVSNISPLLEAVLTILPEGDIIGWKKLYDGYIAKLLIPADAQRSNSTGRKCRASHAQVLAIFDSNGTEMEESFVAESRFDTSFTYQVGDIVTPSEPFGDQRWVECAPGIHFFITRIEAENYG